MQCGSLVRSCSSFVCIVICYLLSPTLDPQDIYPCYIFFLLLMREMYCLWVVFCHVSEHDFWFAFHTRFVLCTFELVYLIAAPQCRSNALVFVAYPRLATMFCVFDFFSSNSCVVLFLFSCTYDL